MEESFHKFDQCLKRENAFVSPEGMQKADEDRDFFMRKLYSIVSVFTDYPDTSRNEAAQGLLKTISLYGGVEIAAMPQNDESAAITNLMQDLNQEPNIKHIKTLAIKDLKELLEKANNEFIALKQDKSGSESLVIRGETKKSRYDVDRIFVFLCEKINALSILEGNRTYDDIISKINHLIEKYISAVELRRKSQIS